MRKTNILFLLALLLNISSAWADNQLMVKDVMVAKEGTTVLAIETNFDRDDFIGYQFDLTLPKGLSLTLDTNNKVVSTSYTDLDIDGKVFSTSETATTYRILASKMGNPRIASGAYVLLSVTVESDGSLDVNTVCQCSLTGIKFSDSKQQKTEMDDVSFTVTISDKVILDENSTVVPPATDDDVDILVKRTIKANQWSTICLPFDMTEAQVYSAFGDDVQMAEFDIYNKGYTVNDDGSIVVNFVDVDLSEGLYGNWPYIIKTSHDVSEFETTAQIVPNEEEAVAEYETGKGKNKKTVGTFTGTLHAGVLIPNENLFLSDNKFYYSVGLTKCKAFRAYFWLQDVIADVANASSRIAFHVGSGSSTGIRVTSGDMRQVSPYYDLQGRRVARPVKAGLYIRNGRKEVVR